MKLANGDGLVVEGTYTEYWVTNQKWRKELVVGDYRRIEVAAGRKDWLLDSSLSVPGRIKEMGTLFDLTMPRNRWKVGKFEDQEIEGVAARCFQTKNEPWGSSEFCFDKSNGALLKKEFPVNVMGKFVIGQCLYRKYQEFGEHWIPTSYECVYHEKARTQVSLVEFIPVREMAQELFVPPAGAKESFRCVNKPEPPRVAYPLPPARSGMSQGVLTITLLVGIDGQPRDIRVLNSINSSSDKAMVDVVRQWRFIPATCDGQPFEAPLGVQLDMQGNPTLTR